jgi:hypothetical protein
MYGNPPPPPGYGYGAAPQVSWGNNPYAPPGPSMGYSAYAAAPGTGGWIKWVYLASMALMLAMGVGGFAFSSMGDSDYDPSTGSMDDGDPGLQAIGGGLLTFAMLMWVVRLVFGLVWLYSAWNSIPPEFRFTKSRQMSPGAAIGFMFVPIYNLYWIFAANVGLCDALDYGLMSVGSYRRGPRALAITSCILQVIPYANLLLAPFMWIFFMFAADSARNELLTRIAQGAGGTPGGGGAYGGYQQPAPQPYGYGGYGGYGPPPAY